MRASLKYLVDESGQKTSVLVPVKIWDELNSSNQKLQAKLDVFTSIQKGLSEVKMSRKGGKKLQTLKEFLK
ncbi:MAG: hypothetical protein Q8K64_01900 [Sediminibacterium sp.]|nr:hypothetical protein [Sediminibacterium sp.]TXT34843.1 MAG: hypothetical protein FD136_54 [Chitinophagaceae bacterium]